MHSSTRKQSVFLTGHKGFIGSHLLKRLQTAGYDVYCAQRDEVPIAGTPGHPEFDYVIHLAATTSISTDFNPDLFHNNITYTEQIFHASRFSRILYASSTSALELTNPYAYTKKYAEWLGQRHPNSLGLRFFNVYGPGNNKGIIKRAIDCSLTGETLTLTGANLVRDFIYIDDVIDMIMDNLDTQMPDSIIDVGTGKGSSIWEAVCTTRLVFGGVFETENRNTFGLGNEQINSVARPPLIRITPHTLVEGLNKYKECIQAASI